VMRFCAVSSDNIITHLSWKRDIHEMVAVDVAQLTFAQAKFCSAKSMRMRGNAPPTQGGFMNSLLCAIHCHKRCAF
jgi:hypothetical protein